MRFCSVGVAVWARAAADHELKFLFKKKKKKRIEVKSKGEKERYTHMNAEVQGISRRDKKAILSEECK